MYFDFVQGRLNVTRLVANYFQLDVCGQLSSHTRQFSFDPVDDFNSIGSGLPAESAA